ncbi:MAG: glycoside hydrolase family 15 protein [Acidimicrobiia bacterium]|nr:glycoside hydrolase family 15 protein [Acidimicrobiia bacterium]
MTKRVKNQTAGDPYPPIGDYAMIGDCHSVALVSRTGSIDWGCPRRFDAGSAFARILDWEHGGYYSIAPTEMSEPPTRAYIHNTMVLATTFRSSEGECVLYDCCTMRRGGAENPRRELLRIVEGVRGRVELRVHLAARFDYGAVKPWIRRHGHRLYSAIGGDDALVLCTDVECDLIDDHDLDAVFTVGEGDRVRFAISNAEPAKIDPRPADPPPASKFDARLEDTIKWWQRWCGQGDIQGPYAEACMRSAMVLKTLTNAPTGAIVAAPTTSLPESLGHARNWDYRFSWIRDSQFTVRSMRELGFEKEADGFRRFVERSAAGSVENLQIMFGVGGERRLVELELPHLEGYKRSAPVRIGNAAADQLQLDVYGYLLDLAWEWHRMGSSPDDDYWRFLVTLVDAAAERWKEPDSGIWEMRGEPRHFVHSKAMCWVTLDRALMLADESLRRAPTKRWKAARDELRHEVETKGFDPKRNTFVQSYGSKEVDASLLLLPNFGFVDWDDPRMIGTVDAVREDLDLGGGLLRRYVGEDSLSGEEGTFLACSFWLAECLANQDRIDEAREVFEKAAGTANDLGLFAEEVNAKDGSLLGNFPQGISHFSHVAAAVALTAKSE